MKKPSKPMPKKSGKKAPPKKAPKTYKPKGRKPSIKKTVKLGGGKTIGIRRPGAFKKKAQAAGMSTSEYAASVLKPGSKASPLTKKQASLAKGFATMRRKRKKK